MFYTPTTALEAANNRPPEFTDHDRASVVVKRLERGNERQQTVGALISAATADFECDVCKTKCDPYVFILGTDDGGHHLAIACPMCAAKN